MPTITRSANTEASGSNPVWHVIDAKDKTLGRLSSEISVILQGKHKPTYIAYLQTGDYVIVINAEKVRVTGNKLTQKMYYRHSGYPGGLRQQTLQEVLKKKPTKAIQSAVKGMLPKTKLGRRMLSRLKLYAGGDHPHAAQVNVRPKIMEEVAEAPVSEDLSISDPQEQKPTSQPITRASRTQTKTTEPEKKAVGKAAVKGTLGKSQKAKSKSENSTATSKETTTKKGQEE